MSYDIPVKHYKVKTKMHGWIVLNKIYKLPDLQ